MEDLTFSNNVSHSPKAGTASVSSGSHRYKSPDSMESVGFTRPKKMVLTDETHPFELELRKSGQPVYLRHLEVEYETYGELSPEKDNVILVTHALSGDAHVAGWDASATETYRPWRLRSPGWWDEMVGPGQPFDTNRFYIICANVLGSCYGTTGPGSIDPETGKPYGLRFPQVTVGDWVHMEAALLDRLGIHQLYAVCGGSLGGQQALEWALCYPERVRKCLILASGPRLSAQGLGFNAVERHSILHDSTFTGGDYYDKTPPVNGLATARMLAHITYLSGQGMDKKFGRRLQEGTASRSNGDGRSFDIEFAVESYLSHQGRSFVERFDANSYLYITRAMDYYDAAGKWGDGDLVKAFSRIKSSMLVASFSSDWLYSPEESKQFVTALMRNGIPVTSVMLESNYGHDAFLVETSRVARILRAFLLSAGPNGTN